jgi:tetratricopeptide (TPR) repeat protein
LLAADPNDPGRLYAHAQSEFWLGFARYDRGDFAGAKPPFERYKLLADRLVARDPGKPDWLQEAGYAEGNLCSLALARPVDRAAALRACAAALARMEAAARLSHDRARFAADLANRHAWLADAYLAAGRLDAAFAERKTQERLVMDLVARDPRNADVRDIEVTLYLGLAKLEKRAGRMRAARAHLLTALALVQRMIQLDPSNQMWRQRASRVRRDLVETPNV